MIKIKNLSHINTNHHLAFDYLRSRFNINDCKHRVLDVGAGANPWAITWITHIADKFVDPTHINNISNNNVHIFNIDIDDPREWDSVLEDVEKNGKFDFVICSHTLEDINNPKITCEMINRIGKSGFVSMPSKYAELITFEYKSNCGLPYKGYHHHRWIYQLKNDTLIGYPKMNFHDYVEYDIDIQKAYSSEIAFLWEDNFNYEFVVPHEMLDNREGSNKLFDLFENDDLVL